MIHLNDQIRVPIPVKEDMTVQEETEVIMGLRTEDFTVDNGNGEYPEEWKLDGTIEVVEPLGGETHMHMNFQGVTFIAKSEGRRIFHAGQQLRMGMNLNHLHLFDADTIHEVLGEVGRFMADVVAPLNRNSDEQGSVWEDGEVITPDGFKEAWDKAWEACWAFGAVSACRTGRSFGTCGPLGPISTGGAWRTSARPVARARASSSSWSAPIVDTFVVTTPTTGPRALAQDWVLRPDGSLELLDNPFAAETSSPVLRSIT